VSTSSFRGNINYNWIAFRSMSTDILKMIIPQNASTEVICTCSHKTAVVATTQIYRSAKLPQADCVVTAVEGCSGELNLLPIYFSYITWSNKYSK
jgi:hypothetical protein